MKRGMVVTILAGAALAGCSESLVATKPPQAQPGAGAGAQAATGAAGTAAAPPANARTAAQFDTTTQAEKQAAAAVPSGGGERKLGTTIASLGDPTDPGFWAETPLVKTAQSGRLVFPGNGKSVQVELRPSGGAAGSGTRVSLPAFQVLGAPLTGLPELVVYAGKAG